MATKNFRLTCVVYLVWWSLLLYKKNIHSDPWHIFGSTLSYFSNCYCIYFLATGIDRLHMLHGYLTWVCRAHALLDLSSIFHDDRLQHLQVLSISPRQRRRHLHVLLALALSSQNRSRSSRVVDYVAEVRGPITHRRWRLRKRKDEATSWIRSYPVTERFTHMTRNALSRLYKIIKLCPYPAVHVH